MTREHKLALILGFALVMVVGVLVSDHISGSQRGVATAQTMDDPIRAIETELGPGLGQAARRPQDRALPGLSVPEPEDDRVQIAAHTPGIIEELMDGVRNGLEGWHQNPTPPAAKLDTPTSTERETQIPLPQTGQVGEIKMGEPIERSPIGSGRPQGARVQLHQVQKGETLWAIAEKYYGDGNLHRKLQAHNADRMGSGGAIQPGTNLVIPSRAELDGNPATVQVARDSAPARGGSGDAPKPASGSRVYIVKRGDVLGTISQRELGTVKRMGEILKLNADKISSADEIWVGLELRLPAR